MRPYAALLDQSGIEVEVIEDPELGHAWHEDAPSALLDWIES